MGPGAARPAAPTELERIRTIVAARFPVYETRVGPQSLLLAVHLDRTTLEAKFDALRRELGARGYVPFLRREAGEEFIEVIRRPPINPRGRWVNAVLLVATLATTVFAGALLWLAYAGGLSITTADLLDGTVYFAVPIMAILGLHEFAHYAMARRRHLDASLPFFLPVPPPLPFGTFGAFVSIRDPFPDRKAMFDVSAAGPIAGFLASLPIAAGGIYLSQWAPAVSASYCSPTILGLNYGHEIFSPSLLWSLLSAFFPSSGGAVHPLAIAGWVGILVTSINLLPIGALDGGRVFRALFGEQARYVSYAAAIALFGLSIFYLGWFIFGLLVVFLGLRNPPPLNDESPLGGRRYAVGAVVAAVLIAGFVVVPIQVPTGGIALTSQTVAYPPPPPSAAIAANLTTRVGNLDLVAHAFLFQVSVVNVTVEGPHGPTLLNASALAAWSARTNWTFYLPGHAPLVLPPGASGSVPSADELTIPAHGARTVSVELSNPTGATDVVVDLQVSEICPPQGGGTARTAFSLSFA